MRSLAAVAADKLRTGRPPTHGQTDTPEYKAWAMMRYRCTNPRAQKYELWGGRGIKVCDRWDSFVNFYADMGPRPPGLSLDRIDSDGNYKPGNCRWASIYTQNQNRRTKGGRRSKAK